MLATEEEEVPEEKDEDSNKLKPNLGNGSQTDTYVWTQTLGGNLNENTFAFICISFLIFFKKEVEVRVPVPKGTRSRDLIVEIKPKYLKVGLKGKPPLVDGELSK